MRRRRSLSRDELAEVGIGTMIVFIASILVASIAAGVLIASSQKLQAKSTQTGNDATRNVASGLSILDVDGVRAGTDNSDPVQELQVWVTLAAGADPVDLSTMAVFLTDGTTNLEIVTCNPGGSVAANTQFATQTVRGNVADCGVVESGDLVVLHLGLAGAMPVEVVPGGIQAQDEVQLRLVPIFGVPMLLRFTTPELGASTHVNLY